jgi:DNA-binding transcriptional regulator of glucitol operon
MGKLILRAGSVVTWSHRGGSATGKIVKIVRTGKLKIPKSSLTLSASAEEPAALIQLIKGGELTNTMVGHKLSTLTSATVSAL